MESTPESPADAERIVQARRKAGENVASYGRHGSQTHRALEEALLALEGGVRAFLVPSGLSAISLTFLALLLPGDHVIVTDSIYAPVRRLDAARLRVNQWCYLLFNLAAVVSLCNL